MLLARIFNFSKLKWGVKPIFCIVFILFYFIFIFLYLLVYCVLCFAESMHCMYMQDSLLLTRGRTFQLIACNVPFCVLFPPIAFLFSVFSFLFLFLFSPHVFVKWPWHTFLHRICLIAWIAGRSHQRSLSDIPRTCRSLFKCIFYWKLITLTVKLWRAVEGLNYGHKRAWALTNSKNVWQPKVVICHLCTTNVYSRERNATLQSGGAALYIRSTLDCMFFFLQ